MIEADRDAAQRRAGQLADQVSDLATALARLGARTGLRRPRAGNGAAPHPGRRRGSGHGKDIRAHRRPAAGLHRGAADVLRRHRPAVR
ncbi:hypothetical protein DRA43_30765 [Micromonospora provocatoris]|nr:hypothetical protein DRA43_30765 [Micromonospora provocatoris]